MSNISGVGAYAASSMGTPVAPSTSTPETVTHTGGSPITGRNEAFMNAQWDHAMGPTASLLSSTTGELAERLGNGSTLKDLAAQQGVSPAQLSGALDVGLRSSLPSWKTSGGHVDVEALANVIAHTPGIGPNAGAAGSDGTTTNGGGAVNTFA